MALRTYGNLKYNQPENTWQLTNCEPHVCIKLKGLFTKLPKHGNKFTFLNTPESCADLLWFTQRYQLKITESDLKTLKEGNKAYIKNVNEIESILLPNYSPLTASNFFKADKQGRNYQLQGKDVFKKVKRLLIGDDIGLGKTIIGLLAMDADTLPCMVVVQTHMPTQWQGQINNFTNLTTHLIKGTTPYNLPKADVYVFKYSQLSGWSSVFCKQYFKMVIFDEIQELRNDGSLKYKGAEDASYNAEYCLGLSASPIYNYGNEIYNVINIIKKEGLGLYADFQREWMGYGDKKVNNPVALGSYLRESFLMLRRTRAEVGRELPPVNTIIQTVGYDTSAVEKAEAIAKQLAIKVTSGSFIERGQAAQELDIFVRHYTGVSKAKSVAEYAKIWLENKEPIVIAAWHRDVYDILLEELKDYNPVMFTGSETASQKEKAKKDFVDGKTNLFIISLRSGIGLDGLQHRCKTILKAELDWSPKVHEQLIGRIDRDGQQEQVTCVYLVSETGSDPLIIDMLGIKSSQSHGILNPFTSPSVQYSDESRIKLLAETFLNKKVNT